MHGDVTDIDLVFAGLQIQRKLLANHGEVLVINRE